MTESTHWLPEPNEHNRPFFEGACLGELRIQSCIGCRGWMYPAKKRCQHCGSKALTWQAVSGSGILYSHARLQRVYHPGKRDAATPSFKTDYYVYVGDTVVRNTNDYRADTMVANGDVGRVCRGKRLGFYNVEYERKGNTEEVFVDDLYIDFSLAYCTTVHKAQGSQFPYVVVLMGANHEFSWKENSDACALLYTAASRARRRCVIVGDPRLFRRAQKHNTGAAPDDVGRFMVDFVSEWD